MRLRLLLALAFMLLPACHHKLTEVVVVVSNEGLVVGTDIDALELKIIEPGNKVTLDQKVELCGGNPGQPSTAECFNMPLTILLVPGDHQATDPVTIEVDALYKGQPVIADGATFRFTKGARLRMDLTLYLQCLNNLSCAQQNKACAENGQCVAVEPTPLDPGTLPGKGDLSMAAAHDLSASGDMTSMSTHDLTTVAADLSSVGDLASAADLTSAADLALLADHADFSTPPDLRNADLLYVDLLPPRDMVGELPPPICTAGSCPAFNDCLGGVCVPCGATQSTCCVQYATPCMGSNQCLAELCEPLGPNGDMFVSLGPDGGTGLGPDGLDREGFDLVIYLGNAPAPARTLGW